MLTFLYISLLLFCTTTTWNFPVIRFMEEMSHVFLFAIFWVAANIAHLLTAAIIFFCSSSSEIRVLCLLSLALALSLLSTSLHTLKSSRKKNWLCCCFFFHPSLREGVDVRTYGRFVRSKMSWMHRQQNFVTHGAPARFAWARAPL